MRALIPLLFALSAPAFAQHETRSDLEMAQLQLRVAEHAVASPDPAKRFLGAHLMSGLGAASTPALLARAKRIREEAEIAGRTDPLILRWKMTAADKQEERRTAAYELSQIRPAWMIVWIAQLPAVVGESSFAEAESLISRAATAERIGLGTGEFTRALAQLWMEAGLPALSREFRLTWQAELGLDDPQHEDVAVAVGFGFDAAWAAPTHQIGLWCGTKNPSPPPSCSMLIENMATRGEESLLVALATSLGYKRAKTAADLEIWSRRARNWRWRSEQHLKLITPMIDQDLTSLWLTPGMTENAIIDELMKRRGVPLSPPESYQPELFDQWMAKMRNEALTDQR